jgi:hypothetical protein
MTTKSGGIVLAMLAITVLTAILAAFLTWLTGKKIPTAILAGGAAFLSVATFMIEVFTSVGPLN